MGTFLWLMLLFPGVCVLSSSEPRQFHVVKQEKTWEQAQQYCRDEFTDLATINSKTEIEMLHRTIQKEDVEYAWIGLNYGSSPKWQWSLADRYFYGENEAEFRNWAPGEPGGEYFGDCVLIRSKGQWRDYDCRTELPFICYDGNNPRQPYEVVEEQKSWADAQRHCREHYTDLASVRNQAENDQILDGVKASRVEYAWIGLFKDAWEWSDGTSSSFRHWAKGEPNGHPQSDRCAEMWSSGQWNDNRCDARNRNFICYDDNLVLVRENKTWMEALQHCRQHHVDLVSVSSEEIQHWVVGLAKRASSPHVWLGLRYECSFGFWFWVSGDSVCYSNWAPNAESEHCGESRGGAVGRYGGEWLSLGENEEHNFICTTKE